MSVRWIFFYWKISCTHGSLKDLGNKLMSTLLENRPKVFGKNMKGLITYQTKYSN